MANAAFDYPTTVKVGEILPQSLINNEHYTIHEDVSWFVGLHVFTVYTEYGSFQIWGEPMLRIRLREFIAWKKLNEISTISAGTQAVGRATLSSATAIVTAFSHPITTIKGIPQGISRMTQILRVPILAAKRRL